MRPRRLRCSNARLFEFGRDRIGQCCRPVLAVALAVLAAVANAQSVEFFSPRGEVKGVRQVTARFAKPMVPFGDPREVDPFTIDCAEKGTGRWADPRNWVYDFARDLPAGVRCAFTVKTGPDRRRRRGGGGRPALRVLDRRPGDRAQPALRGQHRSTRTRCSSSASTRRRSPRRSPRNARCIAAGVNEEIGVRLVDGRRAQDDPRQPQVVRRRATCACCSSTPTRAARAACCSGCR